MTLRLFETTLVNVRTELRPHYLPDDEHGWRLDLSDLETHIGGLRSALQRERQLVKELRAQIPPAPNVRAGLLPRRNAT